MELSKKRHRIYKQVENLNSHSMRLARIFLLITILTVLIFNQIAAQDLIKSRRNSYYRFIYSLSQNQAKQIHTDGLDCVDQTYFYHLVDSIPLDSTFINALPQGDYLSVWVADNQLHYQFRSYSDIDLILHNNYTDLSFTLRDKEGLSIAKAKVKFKNRWIRFDKQTQSYLLPKKQIKGLIEVEHDGFTSFFYIDNIAGKVSISRKILYSFPLKYITIPVKLVLWLPYDIYKSIRFHGLYGLPYYITKPFKDIYYSIENGYPQGFVDKLANNFDRERKWEHGYTVYSKPKYRPKDTVNVKTLITNKKGKLYNKNLHVYYYNNGYKLLGEAKHTNKGNYSFSLLIHDSLNLKLDSHIKLHFGPNPWTHLSSSSFYYEDYELKDIKYTFKCSDTNFYPGDTIKLTTKGEDMNGYIIPDGKVDIVIKPGSNQGLFKGELAYLPDTIWTYQTSLHSNEETEILIPDSVFIPINSDYQVKAIFINSSNEQTVKNLSFNYWYKKDEIDIKKEVDSLKIEYLRQNKSINQRAYIQHKDINNNVLKEYWAELPFKLKIEPNVNNYTVFSNDLMQNFSLEDHQPSLSFATNRNHKAVHISTINPDKISFKYHIYRKNSELSRGYTSILDTTFKANNQQNYFLSVQYEWAGKSFSQNYNIPLLKKQLNIEVEQPNSIYPGQKAEIKIKATDYKGNPVKNVDITAMGLTRKFNYSPPAMPNFEKSQKERTLRNNYTNNGNILFGQSRSSKLDYHLWNIRMSLDSIEFFKFSHPKAGLYQTTWPTIDSLTQVAPFVFKKGELQQAHIIWIDNSIVYSSIATNNPPYSFRCTDGYHNISIRTSKYDISIDSVKIEKGVKNIISLNTENCLKAKITPTINEYNNNEKSLLRASFVRFMPKYNEMTYTRQFYDYNVINIPNTRAYRRSIVAGPFHRLGLLNYTSFKTWSFDYESGYEYSINGDVLKMKSDNNLQTLTNRKLSNNKEIPSLTDEYWTLEKIKKLEKESKNKTIARKVWFHNPYSTAKGNTRLSCEFSQKKRDTILLYTLLFNDEADIVRIYNGRQRVFHDLIEGYYRLVLVYNNNQCFEKDSILLQKGGLHFLHLTEPDTLETNTNLDFLTELIAQKSALSERGHNTEEKIKQSVKNNYKPNSSYNNSINGYVTDSDGEPIPGASIILEGTNHGTITNIDGYYQLNVPSGTPLIKIAFIGYEPQEIRVGINNHSQIYLNADLCALDEVVVIGYGTQRKYSLTGSVSTVQSALQGRVAGVSVNSAGSPGASKDIMIRGVSSLDADKQPLYIIDGVPYEGDINQITPQQIADMQVLKDAVATSIYGARAAHGVIILSLKENTVIPFKKVTIEKSVPLILPDDNKSLRTNFNDIAIWQPHLLTDSKGEASFEVTFPDDITSWDTHILAMSDKGQTAINSGNIKSFLPLSAKLNIPRFITEGDSITLTGKTSNYLPDSVKTTRMFKLKDKTTEIVSGWVNKFALDSLNITVPQTDTLSVEYSITSDDFKDGERQKIPVFSLGSVDNIGEFAILHSDTTITWNINSSIDAELYIESNPLNILQREAKVLRNYKYLCNEQKASKLIGLLSEKQICKATGNEFRYNKEINQLISKLSKSKNSDNLWGWWSGNATSYWVSNHVIKALALAKAQGYKININDQDLAQHLVLALKWNKSLYQRVEILNALIQVDSTSNYNSHASDLLERCYNFNDSVSVYLLRQKMGFKDDLEPLINKLESTLFGSIYWGQNSYHLFSNDVIQTLKMYQLIKTNGEDDEILPNIRNWFFEQRNQNGWINTYYSSNILTVLLSDLLPITNKKSNNSVEVKWKNHAETIDKLPYKSTTIKSDFITINKKGNQTIFAGYNQRIFNSNPKPKTDYFELKTRWLLNGEEIKELIAGKEYQMEITIDVKHKSDYLMLEVPMPAGCSYANKKQYGFMESYREYYKEKVNMYFETLSPGTYTKTIEIIPRFNGMLNLNPAKMEQMYFPVFYGRNNAKKVKVINK